jgi:uncharacterized SAM-binding protein YcdF (DUF218 family)
MFYVLSKVFWLLAAPTAALILLTGASTFWAAIRRSKTGAWLAALGACGLIIGGFTPVSTWLLRPLENRFPQWETGPQPAPDGIIVLSGESGERITVLAELIRRFPQARLVYSGIEGISQGPELLTKFARLGGDPARITLEPQSRNTAENASYSAQLINPGPTERWLLVTSAFHMPRAMGCFRRAGFRIEPYPMQFKTARGPQSFLESINASEALKRLDIAAKEWVGLTVYRIMGWTDAWFPGPSS